MTFPVLPIQAMTGLQILIAEDEKHTRLALHLVLRQAGFNVILTSNGRDAYEKIRQQPTNHPISLIITDFKMPELDGLALIDKLKGAGISIPIMVITGYGNKELLRQLHKRGCASYIDKPFIPREVLSRIASVLPQAQTLVA
ncbi:response regulator [Thiovibrio frasassiensis]|uniref:Response regulator n=1 Tax=Thiovibrio frasassiensis TaxID=2984131 RepID=A0A9X4MBM9_9BACT|nr:response regulator [Thiovibrio frasassiensis]MDG4474614.1 response regulator [Thiovibrio frasassiensis]